MIIRQNRDSLLLIAQTDHARLAADLMTEWQADGLPTHPRRDVILLATREHDNGWREEDAATHVGVDGEPLDFISVRPAVKHRIWPRAAERAAEADPYAGALVAQHALSVHGQQRSDPEWRSFFETMERVKRGLLARCGAGAAATLEADYRFVQMGDQLSLVFCNGWTAPFPRTGGRTILKGTTLEVSPDPFAGRRVALAVPARRLARRTFASAADLRAALVAAPVEPLEGHAAGA
jgi:hypothetical protein